MEFISRIECEGLKYPRMKTNAPTTLTQSKPFQLCSMRRVISAQSGIGPDVTVRLRNGWFRF
jgi:hypothetical protein